MGILSLLLLLPLIPTLGHVSSAPAVFGRYSRTYFVLVVAYMTLVLASWGGLVVVLRSPAALLDRFPKLLEGLRRRRWVFGLMLVLPLLIVGGVIDQFQGFAPGRSPLFQLPLLGIVLLLEGLLLLGGRKGRDFSDALAKTVLVGVSALASLGLVEVALRRAPTLIPNAARPKLAGGGMFLRSDLVFDKPVQVGYHYLPNQDRWVEYRASDGDLYRWLAGGIEPLPPADDAVLARIQFVTDASGYPNRPPVQEQYEIVVTGDSFTVPGSVESPWPALLEQISGKNVLNLAMPGYSPRPEAEAVKLFGLGKRPNWVIVGYFEGNDLIIEPPGFEAKRQSGLSWIEHDLRQAGPYRSSVAIQSLRYGFSELVGVGLKAGLELVVPHELSASSQGYRYPVQVEIGGRELSLAFFDDYVSALTAGREAIRRSGNQDLVTSAFVELEREAEAVGAKLALVYIPSKAHVYLPLIRDDRAWGRVLQGVPAVILGQDGYLSSDRAPQATKDLILKNQGDQRGWLSAFARRNGIEFLDLTPAFQAKAALGAELYYPADTHWNQAGHRLAAELVADFLSKEEAGTD